MSEFFLPSRVYIDDTDAGGVVYHANYLKYMEHARTEFLRDLGFPKAAMLNDELLLLISGVSLEYKHSAILDDYLETGVRLTRLGKTYFEFSQRVLRKESSGAETLICTGLVKIACVHRQSMKPTRIPEALCSALTPLLGEPTT